MAGIKLAKLPDRTLVKLTFNASPDLKQALDDYAALYAERYETEESLDQLIPAMLTSFGESGLTPPRPPLMAPLLAHGPFV